MSDKWATFVCATGLWIACLTAIFYGAPRRPAGEAWVVAPSEKIPGRPMLVRAHVPVQTAVAGSTTTP
jgi:hypothetical protein